MARELPRRALEEMERMLARVSARYAELARPLLMELDWTDVTRAREAASRVIVSCCEEATQAAASAGASFYDAAREAATGRRLGASALPDFDPKATDGAVRAIAQRAVNGADASQMFDFLSQRIDYEVRRSASRSVVNNGRRDPRRVRFARVPMGGDACEFCITLAANGFYYLSEDSAGSTDHYHPNCRCKVVPSWGKGSVEGYDPAYYERLYERIRSCESIGDGIYPRSKDVVASEASEIDSGLGDAWRKFRKTSRSAEEYQRTYGDAVRSFPHCETVSTEDFTLTSGKEVQVAGWMAGAGHDVTLRNPDAHKALDGNTSDALIDGETWDFKRITSGNKKKISQRVLEKETQGHNFVVDLSLSDMNIDDARMAVADVLERDGVEQVIILSGGNAYRMKK